MRVYIARWNDHSSLFRARNVTEVRQQACLLYGRDAWWPRICKVSRAKPEDIERIVRKGGTIHRFASMLGD